MAFTAVTTLVAGAEVTATLVLTAVAEVGMAMSVVGAVTGSEDLMKIGGTLGLVGGIGSMIAGAASGAASVGASELAGETLSKAALDGTASFGANSAAGALDIGSGLAGGGMDAITSQMGAAPGLGDLAAEMYPGGTDMLAGAQQSGGIVNGGMPDLQQRARTVNDITAPADTSTAGPMDARTNDIVTPADSNVNANDTLLKRGSRTSPMAPTDSGSFWSGMGKFVNKNQQLIGGIMQGMGAGYQAERKFQTDQRYLDQRQVQLDRGNQVANFAPGGIVTGARA